MKPHEFWSSRYREIYLYCEMGVIRIQEDFKEKIIINDATTDKLLRGDCMNSKAKIIPLRKTFEKLFKKN